MAHVKRRIGTMPTSRIEYNGITVAARDTERGFGAGRMPPPAVMDRIADRITTGGYTARNRLCNTCHTRASNTGVCMC